MKRLILAGLTATVAAWLGLGQAALVYAAPDPAPATTAPATTTAPTASPTPTPTAAPTASTTAPGGTAPGDAIAPTCPAAGVLTWIVCPLVNAGLETLNKLTGLVVEMLQVRPLVQDDTLYNVWQSFRNLADVAFVLVFMVLIFSTTLSINISAYQLKTLLPKLIVAAILVQISFFLAAIAIDVGNVLGTGVSGIFNQVSAVGGATVPAHPASAVFGYFLAAAGVFAIGAIITWPMIFLLLAVGAISVVGVFVTLAARQLLIAVLIVVSPLAFAAWVLPGTEKFFKLWYQNLIKVILLYPLIVIILSVGGLLTRAASGTTNSFGVSRDIDVILASIIPIIAFLSIPSTFKMAGNIMGTVAAKLQAPTRAASTRLRKSQLAQDIKATRLERGFDRARDIKGSEFGNRMRRGQAKLQAGQYWWRGAPAQRRLATGYDRALESQMKDWGSIYDDQGFGNGDLMEKIVLNDTNKFSYAGSDGKERSFNITKAMRAQAIATIAKQGGNLELNQITRRIFDPSKRDHKGDWKAIPEWNNMPKNEVADMWFRGLGASGVMQQVIAANPIVNPGKLYRAYDALSPSQVANIHGSGSDFYFNRVMDSVQPTAAEQAINISESDLRQERVRKSLSNFVGIAGSAEQRSKVDQMLVKHFKDALTPGTPTFNQDFHDRMASEQTRFDSRDLSGIDFFNYYVTADGKISPQGLPGIQLPPRVH